MFEVRTRFGALVVIVLCVLGILLIVAMLIGPIIYNIVNDRGPFTPIF